MEVLIPWNMNFLPVEINQEHSAKQNATICVC